MTDRHTFEDCQEMPGWMVADLIDAQWDGDTLHPRGKLAVIIVSAAVCWVPVLGAMAYAFS